jgi:hypothetical protein
MEPGQSNTTTDSRGLSFLFAFGRFVGFLLLVLPALATVAALTLLPEYQQMTAKAYELDKLRTDNQSFKDYVAANERLIEQASEDEVLTTRLRISHERLLPRNEVVVVDPNAPPVPPPGVIVPAKRAYGPKPENLLLSMAGKLNDENTRRGLFLLSAVAMMAAMFLFASPEKYAQLPAKK